MIMKTDNLNGETSFSKVKDSLKKSFNYFSIFSVVVGSTIVSNAYAASVGSATTDDDATATAYNFNIAAKKLTVTTDDTTTPDVLTVATGAITDATVTGAAIDILSQATDDGASTFTIASIILDGSTATTNEGAMIIKDIDDAVGDMTVTFSGVVDTDQNVNISITEDTDSETLTVNFDGATTIDDATIIDANDANVTGSINVKVSAAGIFTGGVDLGGGTDNGDGTATITFDGGSAQAIAGAIDGLAANTGNVAVTNTAGAVTFAGAIGATNACLLYTSPSPRDS